MIYKVSIIGAGIISSHHLDAIAMMPQLQAAGIADIDEAKAKEMASKYDIKFYTDYRIMVAEEKPDIVVLALPHFLHKDAAIWCAEQGCHLMLEKPMALTVDECDLILNAVRMNGVKLMIGHTQHYYSGNIKAREIVRSGVMGKLVMVQEVRHINYYNDGRPDWFFYKEKAGGGIFMNIGSHSIDKIQFITDSRIARVTASVNNNGLKGNIEGSGIAFVETESGVACSICHSGYKGVNKDETELIFTNGMIKLATGSSFLWVSNEQREFEKVEAEQQVHPFVLQFNDLIKSIENGTELECSGEYGRSIIHAVKAMYESSRQRAEMILLPGI